MSYSFRVLGATKAAAKAAVAVEFEKVAANQACHERDKAQALEAAGAFIDLLVDDDTKDVVVNMSGSLSGTWSGSDVTTVTGAAVSISAGFMARMSQG